MPNIINLVKRTIKNIAVSFKPLSVHTEAVFIDSVWEKTKKLALSGKVKRWYVITPADFEFTKQAFNLKITKKEFSEILKERYLWLLNNKQKLELHIHLNKFMLISKDEQENLIKESITWGEKELNIKFREFVPGWFRDNKDTREILKKYNLRRTEFTNYKYIHDFDLVNFTS